MAAAIPAPDIPAAHRGVSPPRWALPAVVLLVAAGALLQAICGYLGRRSATQPTMLFWFSLLMIFVPVAWYLLAPGASRRARALLATMLGEAVFVTRVLLYPSQFVYHDELVHLDSLHRIEQTHHLFGANPILPVIPYYPGMETVTDAVHELTGLSSHLSGVLMLAAARLVMMLALFRACELVARSDRAAAIAVLVYVANPQFLFFNSQFSYQSLALPLAFLAVYLFSTREPESGWRTMIAPVAATAATAVTHHLTSMALVGVLASWWVLTRTRWCRTVPWLGRMTLLGIGIVGAWTAVVHREIMPYLVEIADRSIRALRSFLSGGSDHTMFADSAGDHTPVWERLVSLGSVVLICLCLVPAVLAIRRWFPRRSAAAAALVLAGAVYPVMPAGHLTIATSEVTDRAAGFLFVGLGFLLGTWYHHSRAGGRETVRTRAPAVLALSVLFTGGTVLGSGPAWMLMPGTFLVSADSRSVDADNLAVAAWARDHLPPQQRVYTDRVNGLLAAAIGNQHTLAHLADGVDQSTAAGLLLSGPRAEDASVITANRIDYLIADQRLSTTLPHVGVYIEDGEPDSYRHTTPPPPDALTKFDDVPGAQRIYDNGSDRVYDVRGLR